MAAFTCFDFYCFLTLYIIITFCGFERESVYAKHADNVGLARELRMVVNPGCDEDWCRHDNETFHNLVHISAEGVNDTVHYIWSSIGAPTFLVALTETDSSLTVDWKKLLLSNDSANSVKFTATPFFSFAVIFTRLFDYNDERDLTDLSVAENVTQYFLQKLHWSDFNKSASVDRFSGAFKLLNHKGANNESIQFWMRAYADSTRSEDLPRLLHSPDSMQLQFVLDGFLHKYQQSRFALEYMFVTKSRTGQKYALHVEKSIDDEYTPGVFKMYQYTTSNVNNTGFMVWKPVCYAGKEHSLENDRLVQVYNLRYEVETIPKDSIAYAYYGSVDPRLLQVSAINVSFGTQADGYYVASKYLDWNALLGSGTLPEDRLSPLVIGVITAGVGIPSLLFTFGGLAVVVQKVRNKETFPEIN